MSNPLKRTPLALVEEAEDLENESYILIVQNGETFKIPTSKVFAALPKEIFGNLQKTIVINSDEDAEEILADLTENFSLRTPMLLIAGYDATESLGVGIGEGFIILDSGDGDLENALMLPYVFSEVPFTSSKDDALENCQKFVNEYNKRVLWKQLNDYSGGGNSVNLGFLDGTSLLGIKYIKADAVSTGINLRIIINASELVFARTDFEDVLEDDESMALHLEIEPGENFWLCSATCYGSKGIKTATKTVALGNSDCIDNLTISTGMVYTIEVKNAYGRG